MPDARVGEGTTECAQIDVSAKEVRTRLVLPPQMASVRPRNREEVVPGPDRVLEVLGWSIEVGFTLAARAA